MKASDYLEVFITKDGSPSILNTHIGEAYHSQRGALSESEYVFIETGLAYWVQKVEQPSYQVLEVGFGTGLNALLTYAFAEQHQKHIHYTGLEPFPIPEHIYRHADFLSFLKNKGLSEDVFLKMHQSPAETKIPISPYFSFQKSNIPIQDYDISSMVDIVYLDAFSPRNASSIWTVGVFQKLFHAMRSEAVLVSYCANGQVKRNLKSVGFSLENLPGANGKREMTRALKD